MAWDEMNASERIAILTQVYGVDSRGLADEVFNTSYQSREIVQIRHQIIRTLLKAGKGPTWIGEFMEMSKSAVSMMIARQEQRVHLLSRKQGH